MKKVKILVSIAGEGFVWQPGDVVTLPAAEAKKLVAAGYAEALGKLTEE